MIATVEPYDGVLWNARRDTYNIPKQYYTIPEVIGRNRHLDRGAKRRPKGLYSLIWVSKDQLAFLDLVQFKNDYLLEEWC